MIERIESLSDRHVEDLWRLYQGEWWTRGRELADVRRMLEHSDVIVAFEERPSCRLAAFARVLRVKDLDFTGSEIMVRDGKGRKDRVTVLPARLVEPLSRHLDRVRRQHEDDVRHFTLDGHFKNEGFL